MMKVHADEANSHRVCPIRPRRGMDRSRQPVAGIGRRRQHRSHRPGDLGGGRGTCVAGLIAGNGASSNGAYKAVAPKAKLVSIKIAGRDGSSDITHVLAAIQWAVSFRNDYGIRVLNLSLGTNSTQAYMLSP